MGKIKLDAWSGDMSTFLADFGMFANVQMKSISDNNLTFFEQDLSPNQLMVNMKTASVNAAEVIKAGALSIGTGALVGIASYGGVMMFAKASTGTAIATLSGAAKANATLAWFGGGSIKTGGLGVLGGKVVLAGVVLAPIAIVAGTIAAAKGKERLAEAQKVHAEAKKAVAQIEIVITGLEGIEQISEGDIELLQGLPKHFRPFLNEMESIAKDYTPGEDGKIDFNQLSEMEQKTLHLSWLLAQLYYHSLSKPILTDDGKVDPEAHSMLTYSQKEYRQLSMDVTNLASEKQKIKQTLDNAKKCFAVAIKKMETQRKKSREYFVKQGKKNIQQWNHVVSPFVDAISRFENIDVNNVFCSDMFNAGIEEAFESIFTITESTKVLSDTLLTTDEASLMDVAITGMHLLNIETGDMDIHQVLLYVQKSDTTTWLRSGLNLNRDCVITDTLLMHSINDVQSLLNGITGKENLSSAEYINAEVVEIAGQIDVVITKLIKCQALIAKKDKCLKKIGRLLALYEAETKAIYQNYTNEKVTVEFEQLTEEDRKVIEMACNLAKMYSCVAGSKVFGVEEELFGGIYISDVLKEAKRELRHLRKNTYRMNGTELKCANVMWLPEAKNVAIVNYFSLVCFAILMLIQLISSNVFGLSGLAGMLIALPKFFYYKNLRQSQLWFWRLVRLTGACISVLVVEIIGMAV